MRIKATLNNFQVKMLYVKRRNKDSHMFIRPSLNRTRLTRTFILGRRIFYIGSKTLLYILSYRMN